MEDFWYGIEMEWKKIAGMEYGKIVFHFISYHALNFGTLQTKGLGYSTANKRRKLTTYTLSVIQLTRDQLIQRQSYFRHSKNSNSKNSI